MLRVVELASFYPGPFCTKILKDLGAEVVKVEPPGKDPARVLGEVFTVFNAGKKILEIDLKSESGLKTFYNLVKDVDVVVESYRPGVAKRLKVDYETLSKINPRIIYCSISAFGQKTNLSQFPAHDINVLGVAGLLEIFGKGKILDPNVQLADLSSALFAVIAILSAVLEREKTGKGKYIDISMLKTALFSVPIHTTTILNGIGILPTFLRNPVYEIYETADGYVTIGIVAEEHFWQRFCRALDLNLNISLLKSFEMFEEIKKMIEKRVRKMLTKDLVKILRDADVPAFEVMNLKEVEKIEELLGEKLVEEIEFEGRKVKVVKNPLK
ncbi:MAG: CoA transferase [Archaeoglobaceae archaeon]|nr:CoA transferase [Archaeoglobaceae archaeon]MCX8152433.1 CoA transferase [Archaeoglobaceae archaeon]MDW8013773.1 CaiB/BaiF CoA-transferase family protein [Archaeoglobaceae archaeon]